jgi:hypothetical protein
VAQTGGTCGSTTFLVSCAEAFAAIPANPMSHATTPSVRVVIS